jgi:hypothetical protein
MNQESNNNKNMHKNLKNRYFHDEKNFYFRIILQSDILSQQLIKPAFQLPFNSLNGSVFVNDGCANTTVFADGIYAIDLDGASVGYTFAHVTKSNIQMRNMKVNHFLY